MALSPSHAVAYPDDRLRKLEHDVHALHDAPRQLATILHIVTGIEASLAEATDSASGALLQSSAVAKNPLLGRLRRHGSLRSAMTPESQRCRSRKGTTSSVATTRTAKDAAAYYMPPAKVPSLPSLCSIGGSSPTSQISEGNFASTDGQLAQAKVSKGDRQGSRSTSAPAARRPSLSAIFPRRPSLVPSLSGIESSRPSIHSSSAISEKSSRAPAICFGDSSPVNRRPSDRSESRIMPVASNFLYEKKHGQDVSCMILPYSWSRLAWDVLIMAMTTLVAFLVPMGLVYFDAGFINEHTLRIVLLIADFFWLIDVVINFRTGLYQNGTLILEPCIVAKRYAKYWFPLDLVVLCPVVFPEGSAGRSILQIIKLLRIFKLGPAFSRLQKRFRNAVLMPVKLFLGVSMLAHFIACMWRAVQRSDNASVDKSETWQMLYVKDMYWVLMTMTTVGYGDIYPTGHRTRIYAIIIMVLSSLSFGAAITTVAHFTRSLFNDEIEDNVAKAAKFMRKRNVPRNLRHRVVNNLRHHLHQSHLSPTELFEQVSPGLQRELSLSFLSETVLKFPLFRNAHRSCVAELAQAHLWVECFQNDLVSEPSQLVEEVVFVVHGHLVAFGPPDRVLDVTLREAVAMGICTDDIDAEEQTQNDNANNVEIELNAGAWFGESCLICDEDRICVATVMSVSQSELAVLKQKEYQRIVGRFPQLFKQQQDVLQSLRDGASFLSDFAYKPPRPKLVSKPTLSNLSHWILGSMKSQSQILPSGNDFGEDDQEHHLQ